MNGKINNFKIVYKGLPLKPSINGRIFSWRNLIYYHNAYKKGYFMIDGWKFSIDYGMLYLFERDKWNYYIPPNGLKGKRILDVGGGCGETAKFFLDNEAKSVTVIENNKECIKYLIYNSRRDLRLIFAYKNFSVDDIGIDNYDLVKIDVEGYEMKLLPYLDYLDIDIVLESHCNYITDKFMKEGFALLTNFNRNKEIYGGVVQLCRWKK